MVMDHKGLHATPEQADRLHHFAHDLRNRLGGMQQILRMLASPEPGMDAMELIGFAEQQYFKAMRLTEELLDDLGIERGLTSLETVPVDLIAAIRSAIELQLHRMARKDQRVEFDASIPYQVMAETKHLEELLCALLSNASKFSPAGSSIRIALCSESGMVHVDVTDKGAGLDTKDLGLVFTRYAILGSRSTAGEEQGRSTLSRARQWAHAMGGELSATSAGVEAGCNFRISLPTA